MYSKPIFLQDINRMLIKPNSSIKQNWGKNLHHKSTFRSHKQWILNCIRNWIVLSAQQQRSKEQLEANLFKVRIFWAYSYYSWKENPLFQTFPRINKLRQIILHDTKMSGPRLELGSIFSSASYSLWDAEGKKPFPSLGSNYFTYHMRFQSCLFYHIQ